MYAKSTTNVPHVFVRVRQLHYKRLQIIVVIQDAEVAYWRPAEKRNAEETSANDTTVYGFTKFYDLSQEHFAVRFEGRCLQANWFSPSDGNLRKALSSLMWD